MLPQGHFWGETEALSVVCFCPAYWVKYKHQHIWGMKEILQACGFHCIMTLTAFSSSRGAHKKARVTPLHLCRSRPTLTPHPSEEGLFCTLGETIISFISFGHCCQSWQMRSWWETQLWPKSFIEISEIIIKHPFFFFSGRFISSAQTTRWRIQRNVREHKWEANEWAGWYYHAPKWVLSLHYERS